MTGWLRQRSCTLLGWLAAAACAAVSAPAAAQSSVADQSGAELYAQFCASCHGAAGRGDGPVAPALNVAVPDLTRLAQEQGGRFPADDVAATIDGRALAISHGTQRMPVWGYRFWMDAGADRPAQDRMHTMINRLVAHLESLQRSPDR
jgi:mono/diheme cytochrome c family protein